MIKITGLDKLQRELKDAQRAFQSLDGTIATLQFDPHDPASVQGAIRQMESAIDSKTAPYRNNAMVMQIAGGMKDAYRKAIREKAQEARKPVS
ncbi:gp58-like family protein [Falsiroseomonas tokyonensis]|uniref:Gp58-like family protein n=1 Tax=Falsiroseomonas tokyonensis TaxID=430521 RepID=A0ABV7C1N2_9PROT|nr:gp58-like family protein [Falsiroseomonas tokyonensis]MBU8541770.1 hypothetical protein [Falsiroseomonas tokyonensis]OYW68316.1 MAG: hypothetical protein B7Z40_03430 [Bosea sp. 12-68-7]